MKPLLRAERITRNYGPAAVLDGVSIALGAGTVSLLKGRNGSGKTTLVNCLSGFDPGYEGRVYLGDRRLDGTQPDQRARLGVVRTFQRPRPFADLTVRTHLLLGSMARAPALRSYMRLGWGKRKPASALALDELIDRSGEAMSFGEMKVLDLARALATGARVLLLDEPLASLHGWRREAVVATIRSKSADGCAILVIEHQAPELESVAHAVYELDGGQLRERTRN